MPVLIGFGIIAGLAAALLDPYGRKLLLTGLALTLGIGLLWWGGYRVLNRLYPPKPLAEAADPWAPYVVPASPRHR